MDKRFLAAIIVMAIGAGLASELVAGDPCDSTKTAPVKVVRGPRGTQGPQGPVGLQGPAGQVPTWYLLALGLGVGLALGSCYWRARAPGRAPANGSFQLPGSGTCSCCARPPWSTVRMGKQLSS